MDRIIFLVCFAASTIGGICGIGGGVIIKPVLDAMKIMSVSSISFLSGLTVLSMSMISVFRQRRSQLVELRTGSLLAAGAVIGGMAGNALFQLIKAAAGQDSFVGMVQALVLAFITFLTLIYSTCLRQRIPSRHVSASPACIAIGGMMGILSSFLGIGGGPINLAILYFAFSMDTKKAAANSLYIIMFSQAASFFTSCLSGAIPKFSWHYLIVMVTAGMTGGLLGSYMNKKLSSAATDKLFSCLLCGIILICIYNTSRFMRLL